jgi:hypothetical protein
MYGINFELKYSMPKNKTKKFTKIQKQNKNQGERGIK